MITITLVVAVVVLTLTGQGVRGDIAFGSCPNRCTCNDPGVVDCTGSGYDSVPVTAIPCDTKKLLFINNNLTRITRMSFIGLRKLEEIDVKGNWISYIEAESFAGMPNLERVNLVDNKLSTIDYWFFKATSFDYVTLNLDGNPFYCDEDLKENINQIKHKVGVDGLKCAGGEIWRILGKVRGRTYEDVETQIRKNFERWEIALICVGTLATITILCLIIFVIYRVRRSDYATGEEGHGATRQHPNAKQSVIDDSDDEQGDPRDEKPSGVPRQQGVTQSPSSRRIEIQSEDPYNDDDDDAMFVPGSQRQPAYSDSGSERPNSPPENSFRNKNARGSFRT